ncbi:uncharacterized protein LOC135171185 [Diachasmimorpha longicaudata]|uniref:uncharacterized protein LOC135171185 n=1 Tax=Diachasmimorpha longicaudata TaxID=58733 RepID=UPI0030B8F032
MERPPEEKRKHAHYLPVAHGRRAAQCSRPIGRSFHPHMSAGVRPSEKWKRTFLLRITPKTCLFRVRLYLIYTLYALTGTGSRGSMSLLVAHRCSISATIRLPKGRV